MYTRGVTTSANKNNSIIGKVLTEPWEKGGRVVNIDPVPPPFLRADARNWSARRIGCTVPSLEVRRNRRRRRNKIAKASRKANR